MPTFFINSDSFKASNAFVATLGAAPGSTYLGQIIAAGLPTAANAMLAAMAATTAATRADAIAANLGLTGTAATTASTYLQTVAFAGAASTHGQGLLTALDLFTTLQNDATFGTAASAYVARVNTALSYSSVAANNSTDLTTLAAAVGSAGSSGAGSTFTLTEGTNTATGNAADNRFDGSLVTTVAGRLQSWNNSDQLDGGAGTDTLFAQITASVTPAKLSNIEVADLEVQTNALTVDLNVGDDKLSTLKFSNNGGNDITVSNVNSAIATYEILNNSAGAGAVTVTVANAKLTGTSDAATINLSNVSTATIAIGTVAAGSGYETLTVNSGGSVKNGGTADLILDDGNGTSLTTVNFTGAIALDIDFTPATITTVNAATMTAALDVQFAAANGQAVTVTGGTGNDIIDVAGFATTDTVNGGDGTDRLVLTNAEAIAATTARTNVTNVEWIRLSDTTNGTGITLANLGGASMTGLQLGSAVDHTGNVVATFAAGTANYDRQDSTDNGNETQTLTISGVATTDILNVTLGTTGAASTWNGNGAFTINGAETVNILSQGAANTIGGALTLTNTAATEAIVVTGSQSLTITGAVTADSLNASGMTGAATLTMGGGSSTQSITITGTGNADTIIGGTVADILTGGAGADTIQNAVSGANSAANDILTGGAGFDTFRIVGSSASAANYTGSAFISDFTVGSTTTSTDILSIDVTTGSYGASKIAQGATDVALTATAVGSTTVAGVAQNAAAAALGANTQLIKLTTGVAFTTDLQGTFNAAIGSATLTSATAASDYLFALYDTTNSRMVVGLVDAGGNTVIATADVVVLVGTIAMSAADYASFGANNFSIVDY